MTWVDGAAGSRYGLANLPYGVFVHDGGRPRVGVRVGDLVLDLAAVETHGLLDARGTLRGETLNAFMALGHAEWDAVRARITEILTDDRYRAAVEPMLVPLADVEMRLPFDVADYVDFYSSEHHATNAGQIFRPGQPALPPNWKHLPIGYHGRAGTVVVSGTPIIRPCGQHRPADAQTPSYAPSTRLDIEAELGFVVGVPTALGERVPVERAGEHIFGVVLLNDWSARDIQAWESAPLGPFLGKSFATSISAWVVPMVALETARVDAPPPDVPMREYLRATRRTNLDIDMTVTWNGTVVSRPPARTLYWTAEQQLAHMTVNGASLRTGDLYGSGTISGPRRDQTGSFLELTWGGTEPVVLADGTTRTFLADGDTVVISATAPGPDGAVIGFGEVAGTIMPARV